MVIRIPPSPVSPSPEPSAPEPSASAFAFPSSGVPFGSPDPVPNRRSNSSTESTRFSPAAFSPEAPSPGVSRVPLSTSCCETNRDGRSVTPRSPTARNVVTSSDFAESSPFSSPPRCGSRSSAPPDSPPDFASDVSVASSPDACSSVLSRSTRFAFAPRISLVSAIGSLNSSAPGISKSPPPIDRHWRRRFCKYSYVSGVAEASITRTVCRLPPGGGNSPNLTNNDRTSFISVGFAHNNTWLYRAFAATRNSSCSFFDSSLFDMNP